MSNSWITKEETVQFFSHLALLSLFTFVPVWAQEIGLSDPEIALVATCYGITVFGASILSGRISDLIGARKVLVITGLSFGSVAVLGLVLSNNLLTLLFFRGLTGIGYGISLPALIALASDKGEKMGRFSSYGTLGFSVGVLVSGIVGLFWVGGIFIFGFLGMTVSSVWALFIEEEPPSQKMYQFSILQVFWLRKHVYIAFMLRHSFASAIWTFWPLFLVSLGADTFWVAIIQMTNMLTQFVVMKKWTDQYNSQKMVAFGLVASSFTFALYLLPTSFWWIIPIQFFLGIGFAILYIGTLRYSIELSPFDRSTAVGIQQAMQSLASILGSAIALTFSLLQASYTEIIGFAALATLALFIFFIAYEFLTHGFSEVSRPNLSLR